MDHVNIRIGSVTFDLADYDAENDVLYLHVGEPRKAEGEETAEGHVCASSLTRSKSSGSLSWAFSRSSIVTGSCASRFPSRSR